MLLPLPRRPFASFKVPWTQRGLLLPSGTKGPKSNVKLKASIGSGRICYTDVLLRTSWATAVLCPGSPSLSFSVFVCVCFYRRSRRRIPALPTAFPAPGPPGDAAETGKLLSSIARVQRERESLEVLFSPAAPSLALGRPRGCCPERGNASHASTVVTVVPGLQVGRPRLREARSFLRSSCL